MSQEQEDNLGSVWHEVRSWSTQTRLALVSRMMQSLEQALKRRAVHAIAIGTV